MSIRNRFLGFGISILTTKLQHWMAWLVLLLGLIMSFVGWQNANERTYRTASGRFDARVYDMHNAIQARLRAYEQVLLDVRDHIGSSGYPNRDQWLRIYDTLRVEDNFPGITSIAYYRRFADRERSGIEAAIRQWEPTFDIRPPGERDEYIVAVCEAPRLAPDLSILGSDGFVSSVRREAIEAARDNGEIRITRKLTQNPAKGDPDFLMFKAIYRGGKLPSSQAERRTNLLGLVNGGVRMDALIKGTFGKIPEDIALRIYDGDPQRGEELFYASHPDFDFASTKHRSDLKVSIGGRLWQIQFAALPGFDNEIGGNGASWRLLIAGIVISCLISFAIFSLSRARDMAVEIARAMTHTLRDSQIKLRALFDQAPFGIIMLDTEGRILDCNSKALEASGIPREDFIGFNMLTEPQNPALHTYIHKAIQGEETRYEGPYMSTTGDRISYFSSYFQPVWIDDKLTYILDFFVDISDRKAAEARIQFLAHHDSLTGLANRVLLRDRLEQAIATATRTGTHLALLFVDIDFFKHVNDTLNHSIGDGLLIEVGQRLKSCIRESDTLARIGGDEFNILLTNLRDTSACATIAESLMAKIADPINIEGNDLAVTISLGIAVWPGDGNDGDALTRSADVALHHAKQNGRNNYQYFKPEMNARAREHAEMERSLRKAMSGEQFVLYYQPQIDGSTGHINGVEVLLRWQHPTLGLLNPGQFIEIAEERGLIVPISDWILRQACRQGKVWYDAGYRIHLAVNISPIHLRKGQLIESVALALNESGLPPQWLALEVTEGAIMEDVASAAVTLQELCHMGVKIEIDDFGTGHSSLAYLKQLPLHRLKIDQSFVRDVPGDPNDEAIIGAIIGLANNLHLEIIAEGVETESQQQFLLANGCREMQGFLFCRPGPAEKIEAMFGKPLQPSPNA